MTHRYFNAVHQFLSRDTRITILEAPFASQKGWVDSIAFQEHTGLEEEAFCYQTDLESDQWVKVRWDHVSPGWLNDDDLAWLLGKLPQLTFRKEQPSSALLRRPRCKYSEKT